jgi:succinate dehydrogenase/fumarate reductase flavoprotein subunit
VHPTGLVNPNDPNNKIKFLAAEALRGVGGILIDANGKRFCDELGRRDYVTGQMNKNKGPFRLVLNGAASKEIEWHCRHYQGRGLMKRFESGAELAKELGVSVQVIEDTFNKYNQAAEKKTDEYGKRFFTNAPFKVNDFFHVAIVTPVIHYCMGGIKIFPNNRVATKDNKWVENLWAIGEVAGGTHGKNRLGGNSLLDCVVHGRVAGRDAIQFLGGKANTVSTPAASQSAPAPAAAQSSAASATSGGVKGFTEAEVSKHSSDTDCWVILYGEVYDVTKFLTDHPGGKDAIMLFAGKDATEQFDMLHQKSVLDKFGKDLHVGKLLTATPKL